MLGWKIKNPLRLKCFRNGLHSTFFKWCLVSTVFRLFSSLNVPTLHISPLSHPLSRTRFHLTCFLSPSSFILSYVYHPEYLFRITDRWTECRFSCSRLCLRQYFGCDLSVLMLYQIVLSGIYSRNRTLLGNILNLWTFPYSATTAVSKAVIRYLQLWCELYPECPGIIVLLNSALQIIANWLATMGGATWCTVGLDEGVAEILELFTSRVSECFRVENRCTAQISEL